MVRLSSAKRGGSGFSASPEREENTELIYGNHQQMKGPVVRESRPIVGCMTVLLNEVSPLTLPSSRSFLGGLEPTMLGRGRLGARPPAVWVCMSLQPSRERSTLFVEPDVLSMIGC